MLDTTVRTTQIQHSPYLGLDNRLHQVTRVTIMVGAFGPFTKDFPPPNDTPEHISAWQQLKVQEVQRIAGNG